MRQARRKSRPADGDVLGAVRVRRAVPNPFAARCEYRLPGGDLQRLALGFDAQPAAQHHRVFVELRRLSRLDPTRRALHAGDAERLAAAIHAAEIFVDLLRLVADRRNSRWRLDLPSHTTSKLQPLQHPTLPLIGAPICGVGPQERCPPSRSPSFPPRTLAIMIA